MHEKLLRVVDAQEVAKTLEMERRYFYNVYVIFSISNQISAFVLRFSKKIEYILKTHHRASLVAQWLRIHLPMQGTRVRALV